MEGVGKKTTIYEIKVRRAVREPGYRKERFRDKEEKQNEEQQEKKGRRESGDGIKRLLGKIYL